MESNRIKNTIVQFWISPEVDTMVRRIAEAEGRSLSSVYRDLVEKGLVAGGYRAGAQDMAGMIRSSVEESLKPQVERLAAISAKATQISAAAFFLAAYNGRQVVPDYLQAGYDEIVNQSRKLGIEYLKLPRDKSIDEFIGRGMGRLGDDD